MAYIDPSGNETTGGSASSDSTGVWTWTFPSPLDESGVWEVRFVASGDLVAAEEMTVRVGDTDFS